MIPSSALPKTGILKLKEENLHSAYLFVPQTYNPARSYPVIISLCDDEKKLEPEVQAWSAIAERSGLIVLASFAFIREGSDPQPYDQRLLGLIPKLMVQYHIARNKIFLIAQGRLAHYASYAGITYPDKFSAVALLDGAWNGPYEKMMTFQNTPRKQVPFYVALKGAEDSFKAQIASTAQKLQSKGYLIEIETLGEKEDFSSREFQKKALDWLMNKSEVWQDAVEKSKKTWKERFKTALENNITIDSK